jgi:hypothetical protein
MGTQGDILKQLHAAVSLGDPVRYHVVRGGQALQPDVRDGPVVTGRVDRKGLSDELKGVFYAVVETPAGSAYLRVVVRIDRLGHELRDALLAKQILAYDSAA